MNKKRLLKIIVSLTAFIGILCFENRLVFPYNLISFLCVYALIGGDILIKAVKNLLRANLLDENFLMAVATIGAFIIGEYAEGVAVMLFYQTGELFQSYATEKSRKSVADLMDMCPEQATVIRDGKEETVYAHLATTHRYFGNRLSIIRSGGFSLRARFQKRVTQIRSRNRHV